jgi:hypothetical protein
MIRQFDFTWTAIGWLLIGYGLFFALPLLQAQTSAKKFSLELKKEGLPEALKQIEKAGGKNILFTYNGTESYLQSPNQKIPDRKTKCVIETHLNIKQNVIFGANLKPV